MSIKSSQIVAGVAVAALMLGGAYAVGRSQSQPAPDPVLAQAAPVAKPAAKPAAAKTCHECATVSEVRTEERQGKASGLGVIGGAVVGGLLGNQVGGGSGKKLATVGGAVAGGYAGNEIEKRSKSHKVWIVRLSYKDGSTRSFERSQDPQLRVGDLVLERDGQLTRQ
jgi:uncharacterized protein YcfJ